MINPDMATMLSLIVTDAAVEKRALSAALKAGVDDSFNCVTVDGDTSTNDTVIILANGMAGNASITLNGAEYEQFKEALGAVLLALSKMVAKDGEGATKLVEVIVTGAANPADAKSAAKAVSNSPLVNPRYSQRTRTGAALPARQVIPARRSTPKSLRYGSIKSAW